MLPPPTEHTPDKLLGQLVAHRFSTRDWPAGWDIGTIVALSAAKRTHGQWEVSYVGVNPPIYLHQLLAADCGVSKNWVLVAKSEEQ